MIRVEYSGAGDVPGFDNLYRDANAIKSAPFAPPPFGMPSVDSFYTGGGSTQTHKTLPDLFWEDGGHRGIANTIAAFSGEGEPVCLTLQQAKSGLPDFPAVRSVLLYDPEAGLVWAPVVPFTCEV